jgi:conjugative relaxase-like TrwC/TraI family protein
MITTGKIRGGNTRQVEYYLNRALGDDYARTAEDRAEAIERYYGSHGVGPTANTAGRWLGRGADALGLTDQLVSPDEFRRAVLEAHVDGEARAKPVLRTPPSSYLAAEPFAQVIRQLADDRGIDPAEMFKSARDRAKWGRISRAAERFNTTPVEQIAKLGRSLGIDPAGIYGQQDWAEAVRLGGVMVDNRLAAVDITMTVDKSVSLLYATGDDATRAVILHEFHEANRAVLAHLDTLLSDGRRGDGASETGQSIRTDGLISIGFIHDEARPTAGCKCGDPHLHEHVITLNTARGSDGTWSATQIDRSADEAKTAGHLQTAELRDRLHGALGVEWRPIVNGLSGVEGITDEQIRTFSKRHNDVEAELAEAGVSGPAAAMAAAHDTKHAKLAQLSTEDRIDYWRAEGATVGLDPAAALDRSMSERSQGRDQDSRGYAAGVLGRLTEESSSFNRSDLLRVLADDCRQGAPVGVVTQRADRILGDPELVIPLAPGEAGLTRGDVRQSAGGIRAYAVEAKWTTPEMLDLERQLVEAAVSRQGIGTAKLDGDLVDALIDRAHFTLSAEQVAAIRGLTTSGNGVDVLHAGAGSGKTSAVLGTVRQAYEASGYRVIGATTSAKAARVLSDDGGLDAATIASTLIDLDRGGMGAGTVLVLDEASMIGTRNLAALLAHAEAGDAKVVVVGDTNQLAAIDAGGGLRGLNERLGSYTLTANRRQREPWEQVAVAQIAHGEPGPALRAYQAHERVTVADTALAGRRAMVADWWSDVTGHGIDQSLMVAVRNVDRNDLNTLARGVMRESGRLGDDEVTAHGRTFAVGDRVMLLHNLKPRGLDNGDIGTVTALDENRRLVVELDRGQTKTLPVSYTAAGHVDHAYCATVYKAQGATVETTRVLGTALAQESGYVALSRGKGANHLYLVEGQGIGDPELDLPSQPARSAYQAASRSLRASQAKSLALDTAA